MALDVKKLRAAATQEHRDLTRAQHRLDATVAAGGKAQAIQMAGDRISKLKDRLSVLLTAATPDDMLGALEPDIPLVLLPVRLETRVAQKAGGWQLLVRVFPDALHADTHEAALTQVEEDAGLAFWARPAAERGAAWSGLVQTFGPQRAAWIAEATRSDPATGQRVHTPAITGSRFTRPAWADTLPDQFLFCVRADGVDLPVHTGDRVRSPVATGPDPRLAADADDGTDAGMRWMTDFDVAVTQGLGARVGLGTTKPKVIDEVLVLGVRPSSTPADGGNRLTTLLEAHRYTDGLELLEIGTPSNSTESAPSGYASDRDALAEATPAPAGPSLAAAGDGVRLALALGVDPARLAGVPGADGAGEASAQAMLTALWPGTLGYFLEQMLGESVDEEERDALRAHTLAWVRARGPFAPLRAGRNPYGVLPATSLARFVPDQADKHADRLVELLGSLVPAWRKAADALPKAGRGNPAEATARLAEILALSPVGVAVDARRIYPQGVVDLLNGLSGMDEAEQKTVRAVQRKLVQGSMSAIGQLADGDGLIELVAAGDVRRVTIPRVQTAPLSATDPLVDDYLTWLRTATPDEIAPAEERFGAPLLYLLVRHALLRQYVRAASTNAAAPATLDLNELLDRYVVVEIPGSLEPEFGALDLLETVTLGGAPGAPGLTLGQQVQEMAEGLAAEVEMGMPFGWAPTEGGGQPRGGAQPGGGGQPRARRAGRSRAPAAAGQPRARRAGGSRAGAIAAAPPDPGAIEAAEVLVALGHLARQPSARLDRLLRETLDLASHRLDAWVTSLATRRLLRMRGSEATGAHLGAYGLVSGIVPTAAATMVKPPGSPTGTASALDAPGLGFLPAPSLGHAATAAVLRSAHAAHGDGAAFAVGLDSRRARRAKWLLDGVRAGQPLAALLGYQIERALLDAGVASAIAKLRDAAPLRTGGLPPPASGTFETVAPRDVVDGLRLARDDFTRPTFTNAERTAVDTALADLRDALDATGDLLLAEGVHQVVAGTPARGAAAARAAAGTGPPPDHYDVLASPRSGTGLNQRVLLVSDDPAETWLAEADRTPRGFADPLMEGWAASRLGAPDDYAAVVAFTAPDGTALKERVVIEVEDLGLGALDVVAMSAPAADGQLCELERRVLDRALSPAVRPKKVPVDATASIVTRAEHAGHTSRAPLADLIVAAVAAGALLGGARVGGAHEVDPELGVDADAYDVNELSGRLADMVEMAETIRKELDRALTKIPDEKVDLAELDKQLRSASLLVAAAFPEVADTTHPQARLRLVAQGRGTLTELERRIEGAGELIGGRSFGSADAAAARECEEIAAVLIDKAPPLTPRLLVPVAQALGGLLKSPPALGTGVSGEAERGSVLRAFLARARTVRAGVARLDEVETLAAALGRPPMPLRVAQASTDAGDPWVGLPGAPVPGGVTSILVAGEAAFGAAPVGVVVVDDWSEVVPRENEVSALAVHTERPDAEAPHAILVAVPPDPAKRWDLATLRAVVDETFELARIRMVDPPALDQFGCLLPALLLACTGRQGQIKVPQNKFFPRLHP
jgi:hypothetical protein